MCIYHLHYPKHISRQPLFIWKPSIKALKDLSKTAPVKTKVTIVSQWGVISKTEIFSIPYFVHLYFMEFKTILYNHILAYTFNMYKCILNIINRFFFSDIAQRKSVVEVQYFASFAVLSILFLLSILMMFKIGGKMSQIGKNTTQAL